MPKILNVLWLDIQQLMRGVYIKDVELRPVGDLHVSYDDRYAPMPDLCEKVAAIAQKEQPELIVIGNNLGGGLYFAKSIPEDLRKKTLVIWNREPRDDDKLPYKALGIEQFCSRIGVTEYIQKTLVAA